MTNLEKITKTPEDLANFIIYTTTRCNNEDCENCPLFRVKCDDTYAVVEYLNKEVDVKKETRFEEMTKSVGSLASLLLNYRDSCAYCAYKGKECKDIKCIDGVKEYLNHPKEDN